MPRGVTDWVCLRFNNPATRSTGAMIANQKFAHKELRQLDCVVRELRPAHSTDAANVRQSLYVCRVAGRRGSLVALVLRRCHVLRNSMTEALSFVRESFQFRDVWTRCDRRQDQTTCDTAKLLHDGIEHTPILKYCRRASQRRASFVERPVQRTNLQIPEARLKPFRQPRGIRAGHTSIGVGRRRRSIGPRIAA